ncbi:1,4-dihydroxy-2-naphthoate polyprenyltransferase [Actinokineospora guangxiensis]|uniref:1,4-dihydroxy-2-naphthoate octaprenyltransferase n=1 Tax=Actinokineospora guangxiensis TaxID=1490288 RepID=A0ABW0EF00_9PSEU
MATFTQWVTGARVRTLPNSVAPVIVGAGAAAAVSAFSLTRTLLALLVALALQVGVNYANDYSDGVRGTDADRVGPLRLVGSGLVPAGAVRTAAFACFGVAAVAGLVLVAISGFWWLLLVGAACIAAAWFYTGGERPYGYSGWGEVAVFLFFGLVAVLGTQYVQAGRVSWAAVAGAVAMGAFSAAVLVANNLRDVPTDAETGKRTLAVLLGEANTRLLYGALVVLPFAMTLLIAVSQRWALVAVLAGALLAPAVKRVVNGGRGMELVPVIKQTGMAMLAWAVLTGAALGWG